MMKWDARKETFMTSYPGVPRYPGEATRVTPSRWWIVAAVALFVLALGGCSGLMVAGAWRAYDVDTVFSSERGVFLDAGDYTLYTVSDSTPVRTLGVVGPDGGDIPLEPY